MADPFDPPEIPRSEAVLPPNIFSLILALVERQPWLRHRNNAVTETLNLCTDEFERRLIFDLLDRFTYLSSETLDHRVKMICALINETWRCDPQTTIITTRNKTKYSDSSEAILYRTKSLMPEISGDWHTTHFVSKLGEAADSVPNDGTLILLDDFAGTGRSFVKAVMWLKKKLEAVRKNVKVFGCIIAAMKDSEERLISSVGKLYVTMWMRKGISDYYGVAARGNAIAAMNRMETELASDANNRSLSDFNFGYGKSESIFLRMGSIRQTITSRFFGGPSLRAEIDAMQS